MDPVKFNSFLKNRQHIWLRKKDDGKGHLFFKRKTEGNTLAHAVPQGPLYVCVESERIKNKCFSKAIKSSRFSLKVCASERLWKKIKMEE
jgi:hypothetical protein